MRYLIVLLGLLIAASASWSEMATAAESGPDMVSYCRQLERGTKGSGQHVRIPNTEQAVLCWGYMQAMQEMSVLVTPDGRSLIGACPPENTTLLALIHVFVTYAQSHAREKQGNTAATVIKALQEAFPCQSTNAAAGKMPPRNETMPAQVRMGSS